MNKTDPFDINWRKEKHQEDKDSLIQQIAELGRKNIELEYLLREIKKMAPMPWQPIGKVKIPQSEFVLFYGPHCWPKFKLIDFRACEQDEAPVLASDFLDLQELMYYLDGLG